MIQNYNTQSRAAYSEIGALVRACKVDMIETKDQHGKGIEDRLLDRWPEGFYNARDFNEALR